MRNLMQNLQCSFEVAEGEEPICPVCKAKGETLKKSRRTINEQVRRNTDREKFTGGICRRITGKK